MDAVDKHHLDGSNCARTAVGHNAGMYPLRVGESAAEVKRWSVSGVDGAEVQCCYAAPTGGCQIGVVLHPDMRGLRPHFDEVTRRLATHGYAVCAVEPFARQPEVFAQPDDLAARRAALAHFDDEVQLGDLRAAATELRQRSGVEEVVLLGFCLGGMQTLKFAADDVADRAVSFYGMVRTPTSWPAAHLREPLSRISDVRPTLALFGGIDPWTPPDDISALAQAWALLSDCVIVVYPEADHAFANPENPNFRAADAVDAWARTLSYLEGKIDHAKGATCVRAPS